ncbi:MAG: 3-deoxy-7-phosphoheptulonate synthase, partial [Acinetobacter sp.]
MNTSNTSQQHHAESILILPQQLKHQLPLSPQLASQVAEHRQT